MHTHVVLLAGLEGNELELNVVGYRFPDEHTDPWDSNALLVSVRVVSPQGTWEVVDPCLTTWEVQHLIRWLLAAARDTGLRAVDLAEPNLTVGARPKPSDSARMLVDLCVQLELRPPWAGGAGGGELCVALDVGRAALARAAAALMVDLIRYPPRGDDPTL